MANQLGKKTRTLWTIVFVRSSLLMAAAPSLGQMLLQRTCMHSATWMGTSSKLMDCIMDHKKDDMAITAGNQYFTMHGRKQQKCMTRGWQLCIKWKDQSMSWERLSDLKESYPVEMAEYAVSSTSKRSQPSHGGSRMC